jgi:hypothetical protein
LCTSILAIPCAYAFAAKSIQVSSLRRIYFSGLGRSNESLALASMALKSVGSMSAKIGLNCLKFYADKISEGEYVALNLDSYDTSNALWRSYHC